MTDLIEHVAPNAPTVQAETHELDGDLSKMATDLATVASGLGPIHAKDVATIKTKTGPGFRVTYAGLPTVIGALTPVLAANGIALVQIPMASPKDAGCVTHVLGQGWRITCTMLFAMGQASPQAIGSMQTYARRYSLLGLFALAPDEDDGSGNRAEEAHQRNRGQQAQRQDQASGRGSQPAPPKVIIDAFAKFQVPELALVAQLNGTPLGKIDATQQRDLRTLLQRLQGGDQVEDVFGSDAMNEIMNMSAIGERKRTIETKAAVHRDAQSEPSGEMFTDGEQPSSYDND